MSNINAITGTSYPYSFNVKNNNDANFDIKVRMASTTPASAGDPYNFFVEGTVANTTSSTWTVSSDERVKKDISPFTKGLATLI